jgi:hypothetical protein
MKNSLPGFYALGGSVLKNSNTSPGCPANKGIHDRLIDDL